MTRTGSEGQRAERLLAEALAELRVVHGPDKRGEYVAWCPFHPDGQGKAPHQANLHVSTRGFFCHACKAKGSLRKLAAELGVDTSSGTGEEAGEMVYDYRDADGKLLYQVVRRPGKKFAFRRPDGRGRWTWNLDGVRRVPYRLPELVTRKSEPVYVVEGEKDADRLAGEGFLATTNPGGAGKWRDEYGECLKDRDVVMIPDNDEPGREHAEDVAESLDGVARSVRVLHLPGLPEKGDVSNWLDAGHAVSELVKIVQGAEAWQPDGRGKGRGKRKGSGKVQDDTQGARLVKLALASGLHLFHDERQETYAAAPVDGNRRIIRLESRDFTRWLSRIAWRETRIAAGRELLNSVTDSLGALALFEGPEHHLHCRCASHQGSIWIDLDGATAVRVSPEGREVVPEPPVLFRHFASQCALPRPAASGDPWRVLDFVNLKDKSDRLLLVCYLAAALVPDVPVPVLVVHGVQGSAKTTLLKIVKDTLDPSRVSVRGGVGGLDEFALACWQNRVIGFDNLTSLPNWLSDAICRAVTGEGWSKRRLYTDEDTTFFEYRRVIGIAGINRLAARPDLLDRSILLELEAIPPGGRTEERAFWQEYREARPSILGGILDALAKAMAIEKDLKFKALPRMADFARWGAAVAVALGRDAEEFLAAYDRNVDRQNEAAVDASPVAQTVMELMTDRRDWRGTAGELLEALENVAESLHIDPKCREWPKNPCWLSRRLKEVQPNLLAAGIEVADERSSSRRLVLLRRCPENAVTGVSDVTGARGDQSQDAAGKPAGRTDDGSDGNDGKSVPF